MRPGEWSQLDAGAEQEGALSLAICPTDPDIRYLGALDGLYHWSVANSKWEPVLQTQGADPVPGNVRDVRLRGQVGEGCDEVYAAALENGLWRVRAKTATPLHRPNTSPVRSLAFRDNFLFAGTDEGIRVYNVNNDQWQDIDTGVTNLITRQSETGTRIFAAAWTVGIRVNDVCETNNCAWEEVLLPTDNAFVRDVVGSAGGAPDKPDWMVAATSAGVVHWDGQAWEIPTFPPQPAGNVFALAQSSDGIVFAAVGGGGIWASNANNRGDVWYEIGQLHRPVIDLVVVDDWLYATSTNEGIWRWPLR